MPEDVPLSYCRLIHQLTSCIRLLVIVQLLDEPWPHMQAPPPPFGTPEAVTYMSMMASPSTVRLLLLSASMPLLSSWYVQDPPGQAAPESPVAVASSMPCVAPLAPPFPLMTT